MDKKIVGDISHEQLTIQREKWARRATEISGRKARQEQEQQIKKEQEHEQLSAYEACVLRESAKIHELIAEGQRDSK